MLLYSLGREEIVRDAIDYFVNIEENNAWTCMSRGIDVVVMAEEIVEVVNSGSSELSRPGGAA